MDGPAHERPGAAGKAGVVKAFFADHIGISTRKAAAIMDIPESTVRRLLKNPGKKPRHLLYQIYSLYGEQALKL
jgi:plasmid maintenance system antidote protein VapI